MMSVPWDCVDILGVVASYLQLDDMLTMRHLNKQIRDILTLGVEYDKPWKSIIYKTLLHNLAIDQMGRYPALMSHVVDINRSDDGLASSSSSPWLMELPRRKMGRYVRKYEMIHVAPHHTRVIIGRLRSHMIISRTDQDRFSSRAAPHIEYLAIYGTSLPNKPYGVLIKLLDVKHITTLYLRYRACLLVGSDFVIDHLVYETLLSNLRINATYPKTRRITIRSLDFSHSFMKSRCPADYVDDAAYFIITLIYIGSDAIIRCDACADQCGLILLYENMQQCYATSEFASLIKK